MLLKPKKYSIILSVCFLLLISFSSKGVQLQNNYSDSIFHECYRAIYNYEFSRANQLINLLKNKDSSYDNILVLDLTYHWWYMIAQNSKKEKRIFKKIIETNSITIKENPKESVITNLFYKLYSIRFHLMEGNYFKVLFAYNDFKKTIEKFQSNNTLSQKRFEVIYAFFHYTRHRLILQSKAKAMHYLDLLVKLAKEQDIITNTESKYLLFKIFSEIENENGKAQKYRKALNGYYPNNPLFSP